MFILKMCIQIFAFFSQFFSFCVCCGSQTAFLQFETTEKKKKKGKNFLDFLSLYITGFLRMFFFLLSYFYFTL